MTEVCLSIDVEEDLPGVLPSGDFGVVEGLPHLTRLLDEEHLKADFFFLASIAQKYPDLVSETAKKGHGIGNHGWDHRLLCTKRPERQRDEIQRSTRLLSGLCPGSPSSFRAPNFSVDDVTINLLDGAGYSLDSSVLPGRHVRRFGILSAYDHRGAPPNPYHPIAGTRRLSLLEVPVTENPLQPGTPLGQGALNSFGPRALLDVLVRRRPAFAVYLIHPWETVDLGSRYSRLSPGYARVCSSNLDPLRSFIRAAKEHFQFSTISEVVRLGGWGDK